MSTGTECLKLDIIIFYLNISGVLSYLRQHLVHCARHRDVEQTALFLLMPRFGIGVEGVTATAQLRRKLDERLLIRRGKFGRRRDADDEDATELQPLGGVHRH